MNIKQRVLYSTLEGIGLTAWRTTRIDPHQLAARRRATCCSHNGRGCRVERGFQTFPAGSLNRQSEVPRVVRARLSPWIPNGSRARRSLLFLGISLACLSGLANVARPRTGRVEGSLTALALVFSVATVDYVVASLVDAQAGSVQTSELVAAARGYWTEFSKRPG